MMRATCDFPFSNFYMKCSATGAPNAHTPVRPKNKTSCDNRHQTLDQKTPGNHLPEKKSRSGLQSACDELIDKGAIITGE
jgi:hypothetical protein